MNIYDRREWSISGIAIALGVYYLLFYLIDPRINLERNILFYTAFLFVIPMILLADFGSLRIVLTNLELKIQMGFCFSRRTIRYEEILNIVENPKGGFAAYPRTLINNRSYTSGSSNPIIKVNLINGGYCIIQSKHAGDIASILRNKFNIRLTE